MARIGILGPVTVDGTEGTLPPREQAVLAALTVYRGEVVSAETLADAWWGERVPPTWTKALQGCLVQLRKALGAGAIETRPQGYCLMVPADEVDAGRFERHAARAQELLTLGEPDRAAYVVDEALGLWRGRALVELDGWEPGRVAAARLEGLRLDAEELRLDAMVRAGRFREVLAEAQARVAEEPLREHRWRLLALAQYQAGRQGDALRTLHRARRVLAEELGLDPGPDLVALEEAILRQDPSLIAEQLPEPSPVCPYLGLVPYDIDDADGFFGRDVDVSECLGRLADAGVLAVVGPSGSGKSSLVRAGIAAALQRDGRRVVVVTPGARPTDALSAAADSHRASVLVVDQCEEVVTLCTDADEREGSSLRWSTTPSGRRWWWRCAPTGWASCPPTRALPGSSSGACSCCRPWARTTCGRRSKDPPGRPACGSNPAWWTCSSGMSRANRGRCRCSRTPYVRPGRAARGAPSRWPATGPRAASVAPWRSPPNSSTNRHRPNSGRSCVTSCCGSWHPAPRASRCGPGWPAGPLPPTPSTSRSSSSSCPPGW